MLSIYVCFVAILTNGIDSKEIEEKIVKYFNSDAVKLLQKDWQSHKRAFENAVLQTISETYGYKDMNVYVRKIENPLKLSNGYLHSDNQVQIMLLNLELEELPHLQMPEVAFNLPYNVLQIESSISKMIVQANYVVFRNKSDIIYALQDQNPNENSPFRFQQVQTIGKLAIVIEGCSLTGVLLTIMNGQSVNLAHNVLELSKCLYTFEISTPGYGGPPVIVRYNTKGNGLSLEHLLIKPLRSELLPKLQATMFSYINTTAIFRGDFPPIRHQQHKIIKEVRHYINEYVRIMNKITAKKNQGVVEMEDLFIKWDDALEGDSNSSVIRLSKMVLAGLDTLYSAHIGGPYKLPAMKIGEEIRFDFLQIRGEVYFGNEVTQGSYDFSVEIRDVTAEITVAVNFDETLNIDGEKTLSTSKTMRRFEIVGWRTVDFALPGIAFMSAESLITGHLLNTLPKYLVKHLYEVHRDASSQIDQENDLEQSPNDNIKAEEGINNDENSANEKEEEIVFNESEEKSDGNEEKVSDVEEYDVGVGKSSEKSDGNEEKVSDVEEYDVGVGKSSEKNDGNEENVFDTEEKDVGVGKSSENNDDDKEHISDDAEPLDDPEKSLGNSAEGAKEARQAARSDENKKLSNDTIDGVTESTSDEVDKHVIARHQQIKIKNKKRYNKTKTVTDNEI